MNDEQVDYIKSNYKWPLLSGDFLSSYSILIAPIVFFVCLINDLLISFSFAKTLIAILSLSLTFFIIFRIETERRFYLLTIDSSMTLKELRDKLRKLNWLNIDIKVNRLQYLDKGLSGGVLVTIIRYNNNQILVNSKPFGGQPFTLYRDKANYNKILKVLQS